MLWQANRRRIRIRQVFKWAARATLIPAAIVVTLALGLHVFTTAMLLGLLSGNGKIGWQQGPSLKGLSPEQRFLFEGDPNIKPKSDAMQSVLERLAG